MEGFIADFLTKIPFEFIIAVICTVTLTEGTKTALARLETVLEAKYNKQIKFFDHTKIIFVIVFAALTTVCLIFAKVYTWNQYPLYAFANLGISTTCYEIIIKKIKSFAQSKEE